MTTDTDLSQQALEAARYRWIRVAYVDFDEDDNWNKALEPLSLCYTPEEVDAAIDGELRKPENTALLAGARVPHKLKPGDEITQAVELLRFLPEGTALCTTELRERLQWKPAKGRHQRLQVAAKQGWLRAEKRREGDGLESRTYWMAARPADAAGAAR